MNLFSFDETAPPLMPPPSVKTAEGGDTGAHRALGLTGARLVEPRAVERLARSIELGGQLVPCIAVADRPTKPQDGSARLVLVDGYRRVAALRRLGHRSPGGARELNLTSFARA